MSARVPLPPGPRWRWLLPVAALVALFHFTPLGGTLDRAFLDRAGRAPLRATPPDPTASALVLIDDATLDYGRQAEIGLRWPFPRAAFAALIAALNRAGAAHIAVDLTFLEASEAAEQDALLAAVAAAASGVVLARTAEREPVFWDEAFRRDHPAFFTTTRTGLVDLAVDPADNVARRYRPAGSLAAAVVPGSDATTVGDAPLLRWHGGVEDLQRQGVPVLSAAAFLQAGLPLLNRVTDAAPGLTPAEVATALAAQPALDGPAAALVKGRTVFLGASAHGTFDLKQLPTGTLEPGVLVHWTAWSNLTRDGFIHAWPRTVSLALGVVVVALLAVVGVRRGGVTVAIAVAAGVAGLALVNAYAGLSAGWFFAPATPVFAAGAALIGVTVEAFWGERQRRREVQSMFGSYVDPHVVEQLVRDPNAIRLGGETRDATVFFCDLAGFTDLSEQVTPEELLGLINDYLQEVSDCLLEHGAYVDKYIGDAVMAVFGAPQHQPDHAYVACRASLAAQQVLARLNQRFQADYGRTLHMRIGVNTGTMLMGNLGSKRKRNYTVLGDAVNLASRLEGANKEFGTAILLGEETTRRVAGRLATRPLTRLRVKGKHHAVEVSELVGLTEHLPPAQAAFLDTYRAAYAHYNARAFADAAKGFADAATLQPHDKMTLALLADAQHLAAHPPGADWEPVLKLDSK